MDTEIFEDIINQAYSEDQMGRGDLFPLCEKAYLMGQKEPVAEVPCSVGLSADHEQVDWLIMFEDAERPHESFTDEIAAREAFASHAMNWNCHLFKRMESR